MSDDLELLRRYVADHSESAFAELVRRHVDLVYSAALRQCRGDTHLAEDASQRVFTDLARKASALLKHPALRGWLYSCTHFTVSRLRRTEWRRQRREHDSELVRDPATASAMSVNWAEIRELIDATMHRLNARERDAILRRFFDHRSLAEIGAVLGISENAARKTVDRALEKLRRGLEQRGVKSTGAALGTALAEHAVTAAPPTLSPAINQAVRMTVATSAGSSAAGLLFPFMTVKAVIFGVAAAAALTLGIIAYSQQRSLAAPAVVLAKETRAVQLAERQAALSQQLARAQAEAAAAHATETPPSPTTLSPKEIERLTLLVQTGLLDNIYAPLFRRLHAQAGLVPAQLDALKRLLVLRQRQHDAVGRRTIAREIEAAVGDAAFSRLQDYDKNMAEQLTAEYVLAQAQKSGATMTLEQADRLVDVLVDARPDDPKAGRRPAGTYVPITDAIIARADAVLTAEQMAALRQLQRDQVMHDEVAAEMMKRQPRRPGSQP